MNEEFQKRLLITFRAEAEEHLKVMSTGLIDYEKCDDSKQKAQIIEPVYRATHSLKGAARAVNLMKIERICQNIENVFAALKDQKLKESSSLFDNLHKGIDLISSFLNCQDDELKIEIANEMEDLVNTISEQMVIEYQEPNRLNNQKQESSRKDHIVDTKEPENKKETPKPDNSIEQIGKKIPKKDTTPTFDSKTSAETVRISTSKLDSLLLQGEEMLSTKLLAEELTRNINQLENYFDKWKLEIENINVHLRNVKATSVSSDNFEQDEEINNKVVRNFLEWNQTYLKELNEEVRSLSKSSQNCNYTFSRLINKLIGDLREILLLPFSHILDMFPKLVRDISRDIGKEIEIEISGSDVMIDRRILEEMKDPLIHLVRNSIDHGIERPDIRTKLGKNPKGKVYIIIEPAEGNKIKITIKDDGKGIDLEKIKKTLLKQEMISDSSNKSLSEQEILSFIFESGVSTSEKITDISGRGLGMAIVKEKVEKLGGSIKIDTRPNIGTTINIFLPLTLTTFRGIVIRCNDKLFVLQTINVKNVIRISTADIKTVENQLTIMVDNIPVSLVFLNEILGVESRKEFSDQEHLIVIIISASDKNIAFAVDEIIHEQEILLKQFNYQLVRIKNISGACILGRGEVVPLLNVNDLIKSAEKPGKKLLKKSIKKERKRNILVVDDSITSRTLLKDILESAGYNITLAVDGIDALDNLKIQSFDLVVSDVEMPRMDGFELTTAIRKNTKLADLPVVLVTALAKKEHRERGMEAGANAYIVKSSFDQSDLLNIINRLS